MQMPGGSQQEQLSTHRHDQEPHSHNAGTRGGATMPDRQETCLMQSLQHSTWQNASKAARHLAEYIKSSWQGAKPARCQVGHHVWVHGVGGRGHLQVLGPFVAPTSGHCGGQHEALKGVQQVKLLICPAAIYTSRLCT